jgi:hypothetical protein
MCRGKLTLAAVQRGVLTLRQAVYFANMKGPSKDSCKLLANLAVVARDNSALASELALSAVAIIRMPRASYPGELLKMAMNILFVGELGLTPEQRPVVLVEALGAAKAIVDEDER